MLCRQPASEQAARDPMNVLEKNSRIAQSRLPEPFLCAKIHAILPRTSATTLPDLNLLPAEALKALVLAQREQQLWRESEIEHLKLLIAKLQRLRFGRKSENCAADRATGVAAGRSAKTEERRPHTFRSWGRFKESVRKEGKRELRPD
jgi:hypothetical protein